MSSRIDHGMIGALNPLEAGRREAAYVIHRGNALIALRKGDTALARLQAEKAREVVRAFARVKPFSPESRRLFLRGGL